MIPVWLACVLACRLPWLPSRLSTTNCGKVKPGCTTSPGSWSLLTPPTPLVSRWPDNSAPTWTTCWPYHISRRVWMFSATTSIRSAPAIGPACPIATISKPCRAPTTISKVTSVTLSGACSAPPTRRDKRAALCSALVLGSCYPDRPLRPDVWPPYARSRPISWQKNKTVCASTRNDSVYTLDLSDESTPNLPGSVNSGSLSRPPQRGDFCGVAIRDPVALCQPTSPSAASRPCGVTRRSGAWAGLSFPNARISPRHWV